MKKFKIILSSLLFSLLLAGPAFVLAAPTNVSASNHDESCEDRFLGIPPWYRGLTDDECNITGPSGDDAIANYITKIVLNIIEAVVVIIGYIAAFFIIYGGFRFLTGGSDPGAVEKARKSILNAVIGLVIALGAVAIVNFIFGIIP
jgi:hypothetical protein